MKETKEKNEQGTKAKARTVSPPTGEVPVERGQGERDRGGDRHASRHSRH